MTRSTRRLEREFEFWAHQVALAEKLRNMRMERAQDGEAFAVLVTGQALDHPIQLDLKLLKADQVKSPIFALLADGDKVDGIRFDQHVNPLRATSWPTIWRQIATCRFADPAG